MASKCNLVTEGNEACVVASISGPAVGAHDVLVDEVDVVGGAFRLKAAFHYWRVDGREPIGFVQHDTGVGVSEEICTVAFCGGHVAAASRNPCSTCERLRLNGAGGKEQTERQKNIQGIKIR